jgi:hypothetical protein
VSGIAYGVRVECDLALDDLPQDPLGKPEISVEVHRTPSLPIPAGLLLNTFRAQDRTAKFFFLETHAVIFIEGLFYFDLWLDTGSILCYCTERASDQLIRYWILQQILPIFLVLAGDVDLLHGTATTARSLIDTSSQADEGTPDSRDCIAFLGPSHAGKSTLLSYFLSRGHGLVTDDHLALPREGPFQVFPAIPYYRAYRSTEDLGVVWKNYSPEPKQLQRVYILHPTAPDMALRSERLSGADAVAALMVDNHYLLHDYRALRFIPLVENRFRRLADLSRKISVFRLYVPRSLDRLSELYDYILLDLASKHYDQV